MAQSHGLHTDMQANAVGPDLVRRGRRVWWTVYTLDRKMSSSMGVPNSLHDEDVTTPLTTSMDSEINPTGQILHVKICQVLGKVVSSKDDYPESLECTDTPMKRSTVEMVRSTKHSSPQPAPYCEASLVSPGNWHSSQIAALERFHGLQRTSI